MSRIVLDVSSQEHHKIKSLAALHAKSIKDYVLEKVFADDLDDKKAMEALQALLSERIKNAKEKGSTGKSFTQIVQDTINSKNEM